MRDFESYQAHYADQPYERYLIHYRKRKIAEILGRFNHGRLLEIGCGLDPIFTTVTTFDKLWVVEPAKKFFEHAVNEMMSFAEPDRIVLKRGFLEDVVDDLQGQQFNFILASCLLHEVENPVAFLAAIHRIASDDTVIHINVPNARSFHRLLAVEMGLISNEFEKSLRNIQFQQNNIYDTDRLSDLVKECGFQIVEKGTFSFKPFTHEQMERMLQAKLLTPEMLDGFFRMEKYLPGLGSELYVNIRKRGE